RIRSFIANQYQATGDTKQALSWLESIVRFAQSGANRSAEIRASRAIAQMLVAMGNLSQAEAAARRVEELVQEARGSPSPGWRAAYAIYGNSWEAEADRARATIANAHGRHRDAEAAFRRVEAFERANLGDLDKWQLPPPRDLVLRDIDIALLAVAGAEAKL